MTRLDHNRAVAQLADKTGAPVSDITQHGGVGQPLTHHVSRPVQREGEGERAWDVVGDEAWVADEFIPRVGKRGAEIIEARGASSAASAANAAIDHVHDWVQRHGGRRLGLDGRAVPGAYGVEEGIISSFPCRYADGEWEIVAGPRRARLLTGADRQDGRRAREERDAVRELELV